MFDPKTQILVVDDMFTMRKLIVKICQDLGFSKITEAEGGQTAWETVRSAQSHFGLIISDWNMPNGNGLDFLKRVRADSRLKYLPFIMITAEAEQVQVVEAVKSGVSNYIVKPFIADQLRDKLEAVHKKMTA